MYNYDLKRLIKQPKCYKNLDNPTCIDFILTNVPRTYVLETELTDFHSMTLTVLRKMFNTFQPRVIEKISSKAIGKDLQSCS